MLDCIESHGRPLPTELSGRQLDECLQAIAEVFRRHGRATMLADL